MTNNDNDQIVKIYKEIKSFTKEIKEYSAKQVIPNQEIRKDSQDNFDKNISDVKIKNSPIQTPGTVSSEKKSFDLMLAQSILNEINKEK